MINIKKIIKKTGKMVLYTLLILILSIILFVNFAPTFGSSSKGESKSKVENSIYFKDGKFENIEFTTMNFNKKNENNKRTENNLDNNDEGSMLDFFFGNKNGKNPLKPIPNKILNKDIYNQDSNKTLITWLGHSTILLKVNNKNILTDPVFSKRASPLFFLGPKAFEYENEYKIEDLPKIDIILISHDHYDHLDMNSIKQLKDKVNLFYVPLGVKAHLLKWGVAESKIIELDWYEINILKQDNISIDNISNQINFISIPTRHFSGRGLSNRMSTQWTSWIIKTEKENIYFGGDSGYSKTFKELGNKYGKFDIVFLENGAYNKNWESIHMMPNQTMEAAIDMNAKVLMPIHQFKFDLAFHNWTAPIESLLKTYEYEKNSSNKNNNLTIATPIIGETFTLNPKIPQEKWWRELK